MFIRQKLLRGLLFTLVAVLVTSLASPAWARAENQDATGAPLADRLPAEAILYVGWVGADRMAELWDGTHTQALVQQSQLEDFFARYIPEVLDKLAQEEPDAAQAVELAKELLPLFIKRPSAFAFGGVNLAAGQPMPKLIFAIDAGDEANALEQRLRALMRQADQQPMTMFLGNKNGIVRFAIGYDLDELDRLAAGEGANSLAASDAFKTTMGGLNDSPTSAMYIDFAGLVALGEEAVQMFAPPEEQPRIMQMIETLGVKGLKQLGATSGFSGKLYETQAFLGYSGSEGVLSLMPKGPLDDQTIAAIPAGSRMVIADQFDFAALFALVRQIIVQAHPEAEEHIAQVLAQVNEHAGVDVEADVLRQLGTTWAFYVSPRLGNGMFSGLLLNRPRDAARMEESLTSISRNILEMANEHLTPQTEGNVALPGRSVEFNGQTLHILNTPLVAPTWSIDQRSGLLQVAFYPQMIMSAQAAGAEPFVQSQAWRSLQQQLAGDHQMTSLTYYDLPAFASDSYPMILMLAQAGFGGADLFSERLGTRPPTIVLPPLSVVLAHVEPSGSVSWVDDNGLHFRSLEPFPLSGLLAQDMQSMAIQSFFSSMGTGIQAAQQAREEAERARAMAEEARQRAEEARQRAQEERDADRPE